MNADPGPGSRLALSINPLGFIQFGPSINTEGGLRKNVMINVHTLFPSLGALSRAAREGEDKLTGITFGAGPVVFFGNGRSQPYGGFFMDY